MDTRRAAGVVLVGLWIASAGLGQATRPPGVHPEGATLWPVGGQVGTASVEPGFGPADWNPTAPSAETLLALERLRRHLVRDGANPEGPPLKWIVPTDQYRVPLDPPTAPTSSLVPAAITLFSNTNPTVAVPGGFSSTVNEPASAAKENRIFYSMNWYAASSTNGGTNWSGLDPFSGPAAPVNAGFCCDQTMIYDHRTDTLFYLQQYIKDGTTGTQRINVDRGFDGAWDCFYDFTPANVGLGTGEWFDYPDLAISEGFLFHSSNIFTVASDAWVAGAVLRYPLAPMSTCAGFSYSYYTDAGFGSFRFTQGATDTMYFAAHISNTALRIWRWLDAEGFLTTFDRTVNAWSDATRVCPGPDGRDWCGFIDGRMTAGFIGNTTVGFLWTAAQDGTFAYPQVRVARFNAAGGLALIDQPVVWSSGNAWAYPSAAANARGDVGGTLFAGGGASLYPSCFAYLADAENSYVLAPLENIASIFGTIGPGSNRSGDYLTTREDMPNRSRFSGTCFAYNSTSASTSRHLRFGRTAISGDLLRNGFETGNTGVWTATVP